MRTARAIAALAVVFAALWAGASSAAAQTTTTLPGSLPVTGAPGEPADAADDPANEGGALARTGVELIPVVNAGIGLIGSGAALLVGAEVRGVRRRRRSLWSY